MKIGRAVKRKGLSSKKSALRGYVLLVLWSVNIFPTVPPYFSGVDVKFMYWWLDGPSKVDVQWSLSNIFTECKYHIFPLHHNMIASSDAKLPSASSSSTGSFEKRCSRIFFWPRWLEIKHFRVLVGDFPLITIWLRLVNHCSLYKSFMILCDIYIHIHIYIILWYTDVFSGLMKKLNTTLPRGTYVCIFAGPRELVGGRIMRTLRGPPPRPRFPQEIAGPNFRPY